MNLSSATSRGRSAGSKHSCAMCPSATATGVTTGPLSSAATAATAPSADLTAVSIDFELGGGGGDGFKEKREGRVGSARAAQCSVRAHKPRRWKRELKGLEENEGSTLNHK